MPSLFDPITLRGVTIRNRIGVSPMCQYTAVDGRMGDWHLVHLGGRAVGGAGLIIAEATAVVPEGRISPGDAGLWSDDQIAPFARVNDFIKLHGATPGVQLAHAGRKASAARPWEGDGHIDADAGGWQTVAPSPVPFGGILSKVPRELTIAEIKDIQGKFAAAAKRALAAGVQFIELHAAHGYLSHEFLSPLSNKRTDQYGGSFENRIRFVVEAIQGLRKVMPDSLPLGIRLSCTDWHEDGWTIEDTVSLVKKLKGEGIDLVDCSSGFNHPDYSKVPFGAGFQVPFSEQVRREADIATGTVGLITEPMQAEEIIRNGRADIVLLAREMLRNPYWPIKAAETLRKQGKSALPIQYSHWLKN